MRKDECRSSGPQAACARQKWIPHNEQRGKMLAQEGASSAAARQVCSGEKMGKKTVVSIAHSGADLGKPAEYTRDQLALVKVMIKSIADETMGGMQNIVKAGDKVLIKINTVI